MSADTVIFCCVIVFIETVHLIERRDLYNRIMSGSLPEYRSGKKKTEHIKSRHDVVVDKWRKGEIKS